MATINATFDHEKFKSDRMDERNGVGGNVCPAGGPHNYEYLSAADQNDDSGRRFYGGWFCAECGKSTPNKRLHDSWDER